MARPSGPDHTENAPQWSKTRLIHCCNAISKIEPFYKSIALQTLESFSGKILVRLMVLFCFCWHAKINWFSCGTTLTEPSQSMPLSGRCRGAKKKNASVKSILPLIIIPTLFTWFAKHVLWLRWCSNCEMTGVGVSYVLSILRCVY